MNELFSSMAGVRPEDVLSDEESKKQKAEIQLLNQEAEESQLLITEKETSKHASRLAFLPKHALAKSVVPSIVPRSAKVESNLAMTLESRTSDPVIMLQIDWTIFSRYIGRLP